LVVSAHAQVEVDHLADPEAGPRKGANRRDRRAGRSGPLIERVDSVFGHHDSAYQQSHRSELRHGEKPAELAVHPAAAIAVASAESDEVRKIPPDVAVIAVDATTRVEFLILGRES